MLNNFNKLAIVGNKFIYLLDIIVLCLWVPKKIQNNPSNVGMGRRTGWAWLANAYRA